MVGKFTPPNKVKPAWNYTHPSEQQYWDESQSTVAKGVVTDTTKTAGDYGVIDPPVVEPIAGTKSEAGNGAGTP